MTDSSSYPSRGVCLIAYGEKAIQEAVMCEQTVRQQTPYPISVFTILKDFRPNMNLTNPQQARFTKTALPSWSPFDDTLYLDADTRVFGDVSVGFDALDAGFDMVIIPSSQQGDDLLWHVGDVERNETLERYGCADVLQLQGGVFWFRRNEETKRFFDLWRYEWLIYQGEDQAALLRAMKRSPVKIHLLGFPFNRSNGAIISHKCGAIRQ